jgi:hypothetical protein
VDEVNTDARRMGIRTSWRKALEREEWRKLLMEAKTLSRRAEGDDGSNVAAVCLVPLLHSREIQG